MQRKKDMKLCREGDNRELSIRKDLHRFPIFLCASWNTRPACREFCCYFNNIFEVMQLFFLNCCRGGKAALVNGDCLYMEGERRPDTMSVLSEGSWTGQDTSAKKSLVCEVGGSWPFFTSRVTSANAQKHYWGIQQKKFSLFLSSKRRLMEWWMPI